MALAVWVGGATLIQVGTGGAGALEDLGYNRNNVDTIKEGFFLDVPGDQNGGDDGPPIEIQYLGEIARVRVEMTKFDNTIADKVRARVQSGTAGTISSVGALMFAGTLFMRLRLTNANLIRNFPRAIPRGAIEIGRGSKFSTFVCEFECHKDNSGILYNGT